MNCLLAPISNVIKQSLNFIDVTLKGDWDFEIGILLLLHIFVNMVILL